MLAELFDRMPAEDVYFWRLVSPRFAGAATEALKRKVRRLARDQQDADTLLAIRQRIITSAATRAPGIEPLTPFSFARLLVFSEMPRDSAFSLNTGLVVSPLPYQLGHFVRGLSLNILQMRTFLRTCLLARAFGPVEIRDHARLVVFIRNCGLPTPVAVNDLLQRLDTLYLSRAVKWQTIARLEDWLEGWNGQVDLPSGAARIGLGNMFNDFRSTESLMAAINNDLEAFLEDIVPSILTLLFYCPWSWHERGVLAATALTVYGEGLIHFLEQMFVHSADHFGFMTREDRIQFYSGFTHWSEEADWGELSSEFFTENSWLVNWPLQFQDFVDFENDDNIEDDMRSTPFFADVLSHLSSDDEIRPNDRRIANFLLQVPSRFHLHVAEAVSQFVRLNPGPQHQLRLILEELRLQPSLLILVLLDKIADKDTRDPIDWFPWHRVDLVTARDMLIELLLNPRAKRKFTLVYKAFRVVEGKVAVDNMALLVALCEKLPTLANHVIDGAAALPSTVSVPFFAGAVLATIAPGGPLTSLKPWIKTYKDLKDFLFGNALGRGDRSKLTGITNEVGGTDWHLDRRADRARVSNWSIDFDYNRTLSKQDEEKLLDQDGWRKLLLMTHDNRPVRSPEEWDAQVNKRGESWVRPDLERPVVLVRDEEIEEEEDFEDGGELIDESDNEGDWPSHDDDDEDDAADFEMDEDD